MQRSVLCKRWGDIPEIHETLSRLNKLLPPETGGKIGPPPEVAQTCPDFIAECEANIARNALEFAPYAKASWPNFVAAVAPAEELPKTLAPAEERASTGADENDAAVAQAEELLGMFFGDEQKKV